MGKNAEEGMERWRFQRNFHRTKLFHGKDCIKRGEEKNKFKFPVNQQDDTRLDDESGIINEPPPFRSFDRNRCNKVQVVEAKQFGHRTS